MKPAVTCAIALLLAACTGTTTGPPSQQLAEPAAATPTASAPSAAPPACNAGETVVFGCATGADSGIALCGSANHTHLQYRESGDLAEPGWPADDVPAAEVFRSGTLMYSGGGGAFLRFERDGLTHTLYTGIGRGWEKAGLVVKQGNRTVREAECEGEVVSIIGPEFFEQASIPADDSGFEIP
ncbi:hypothetical protein [Luteimonas sp. A478]